MLTFLHLNYNRKVAYALFSFRQSCTHQSSVIIALLAATLLMAQPQELPKTFIERDASWYYYDSGFLSDDWYKSPIDMTWKKGQSPFGYNIDSISTKLDYGADKQKKRLVYYFKKPVVINRPELEIAYVLNIRRDDGVIVYINGKEVGRQNIFPKSESDNGKDVEKVIEVVKGTKESTYNPMLLNSSNFKNGLNIISVSLHQIKGNSSDVVFALELKSVNTLTVFQDEINALSKLESTNSEFPLFSAQLDLEKKNTQHLLVKQKLDYITQIFTIIISLLICALLLIGWLTLHYFKKSKSQISEIKSQEYFIEKSKQDKLKDNLQNIEHFSFLESLQTKLKQLQNSRLIESKDVSVLIQLIKGRLNNAIDLEEITIHVDSLNTNFSQRLLQEFQSLSQSEIRYCCLMRVQFSTKEISRILHVSPRSIQTARYRIKKKLNLKESENLIRFLMQY